MALTSAHAGDAPLRRYLVVTFGISWLAGGLAGLGNLDVLDLPTWFIGMGNVGFLLGPGLGALAVQRGAPGGALRAVRDDLVRPVPGRWYGIALAGGVGGAALVAALLMATGAPVADLGTKADWIATPIVLVGTTLAAVLEELGWRGTLLPVLRERLGLRTSVVAVGITWGIWHLPLLLTDEGVNAEVPLYAYPTLALGLSAVLAWLYDSAGRAVAVPALAHGTLNATMTPVLLASHSNGDLDHFYAVAVVVSVLAGGVALHRANRPLVPA